MLHYKPNTFAQTFFFVYPTTPLAVTRRTIHTGTIRRRLEIIIRQYFLVGHDPPAILSMCALATSQFRTGLLFSSRLRGSEWLDTVRGHHVHALASSLSRPCCFGYALLRFKAPEARSSPPL